MSSTQHIDTIAYICIKDGKILSTRSRGKDTYYIPGGKREESETDEQALIREVKEEAGVDLIPETIKHYGTFEAQAHGRPEGTMVRAACYTAEFKGDLKPGSEKEEIVWLGYEGREKSSPLDKLIFDDLKAKGLLTWSKEFYQNLPKKRIASGALILNQKKEILLVKPVYKETWEIPGGITEVNESPRAGCEREIKEELGLDISISELLCVDYVADSEGRGDSLQIIFDGGVLGEEQIKAIKLNQQELSEYRFFGPTNIDVELKDKLRLRVQKALEAKKGSKTIYLENRYH